MKQSMRVCRWDHSERLKAIEDLNIMKCIDRKVCSRLEKFSRFFLIRHRMNAVIYFLKNFFRLSFWSSYSLYIEKGVNVLTFQKTGKENFVDIDFWLIQKMKHGDENAFNVFVHKYYKKRNQWGRSFLA